VKHWPKNYFDEFGVRTEHVGENNTLSRLRVCFTKGPYERPFVNYRWIKYYRRGTKIGRGAWYWIMGICDCFGLFGGAGRYQSYLPGQTRKLGDFQLWEFVQRSICRHHLCLTKLELFEKRPRLGQSHLKKTSPNLHVSRVKPPNLSEQVATCYIMGFILADVGNCHCFPTGLTIPNMRQIIFLQRKHAASLTLWTTRYIGIATSRGNKKEIIIWRAEDFWPPLITKGKNANISCGILQAHKNWSNNAGEIILWRRSWHQLWKKARWIWTGATLGKFRKSIFRARQ